MVLDFLIEYFWLCERIVVGAGAEFPPKAPLIFAMAKPPKLSGICVVEFFKWLQVVIQAWKIGAEAALSLGFIGSVMP